MHRGPLLACAIGAVGCAQIAGIDSTSGDGRKGVSLSIDRASIGATVATAPQPLAGLSATYLPSDAPAVPATPDPDGGEWSADLRAAAPVLYTLPDYPEPILRLTDFPSRDIAGVFGVLEHPSPAPAPTDAMISLSVALDTPFDGVSSYQAYTLGSWTYLGLPVPAVGASALTATYPFSMATSITGRPLEAIAPDDAFLVLRYNGPALAGVGEVAPFAQTGNDALTATMAAVAQDQSLTASIGIAALGARYGVAAPAVANLTMGWSLTSAPGAALGSNTGPTLSSGGIAVTDTGDLAVAYGDPFGAHAWPVVFTFSSYAYRSYAPDGVNSLALYAGLYQLSTPVAGQAESVALAVGLPDSIAVDGVALTADGATVPAGASTISWVSDVADNTLYQTTIYEVVPNGTTYDRPVILTTTGLTPSVAVPDGTLQSGHMYTIRAVCIAGGYPSIATGDMTDRTLPISVGYLDSGVFTVLP